MSRPLALLAALLFAAISVSSACMAGPLPDTISFELKPSLRSGNLQLALWDTDTRHHNLSGDSFAPKDLTGLDLRAFAAGGPVTFALVRETGRIDCAGTSNSSVATGNCRFTADPAFFWKRSVNHPLSPGLFCGRFGPFVSATSTSPLGRTYSQRG